MLIVDEKYNADTGRFVSPQWVMTPLPGNKWLLVISGTVIANFSSGQGAGWRHDTLRILPDWTGPFTYAGNDPTTKAVVFRVEQYSTFAALNAIFDKDTAVNAGFAVDAFRPYFVNGARGLTTGSGIDVEIAVQDVDAQLLRVGYQLTCVGTFDNMPFLDAPDNGLGSCTNYFLNAGCDPKTGVATPMTGLEVRIKVETDMVSDHGFGFQVNCDTPKNSNLMWQQFCIILDPANNELTAIIDIFKADGTILINQWAKIAQLPSLVLPAGYQLSIALANDANGNITGATFVAWDADDRVLGSQTITLVGLTNAFLAADRQPISDITLNLVGPYSGGTSPYRNTSFTSGSGTMTYTAAAPMTLLRAKPDCVENATVFTNEISNSRFGRMPAVTNATMVQSFTFQAPAPGAAIDRSGPGLRAMLKKP